MKKLTKIFGVVIITFLVLTSCNQNSIDKDAKKAAELQCRVREYVIKSNQGEAGSAEELKKREEELDTFKKTVIEKYKSDSEKEEFSKKVFEELKENCRFKG